jgi:hypothetical protein
MQKTREALKEAMAYLEINHRTEDTLQLRRLLREAYAEINDDQVAAPIPSFGEASGEVMVVKKYNIDAMIEMFPPMENWQCR